MKIRLTILTENDKKLPEEVDVSGFEETIKAAWQLVLPGILSHASTDPSETVTVEKAEILYE